MKAIVIHKTGGPDVLSYEDIPAPSPSKGQAVVDLKAIGVNYTDIYSRSRQANLPSIPWILGREGAGIVSAVGEGVTEVKVGDQVAYYGAAGSPGTYAEKTVAPSWRLVKLPKGITFEQGAAAMLQGMTAHFLCHAIYPLKKGDKALVHAGAGGTGLLLIQMLKRLGVYVFATVSTQEKARIAEEAGADHVIIYTREDFEGVIRNATKGEGVQVVYDSVGKDTFERSLKCLARRGLIASYGQASGPAPTITSGMARSSIFVIHPRIDDFTVNREELFQRAGDLLEWIRTGELKLRIHKTYPLAKAAEAQRDLESRGTSGKLLLIP